MHYPKKKYFLSRLSVCFLFLFGLGSCAYMQKKPYLIDLKKNSFHDEKNVHELFQSFWKPPLQDKAPLNVGILTQKEKIEFITVHASSLLIVKNNKPYMIHSPKNTHWVVEHPKKIRPALVRYFPSVSIAIINQDIHSPQFLEEQKLWLARGFSQSKWVHQSNKYPTTQNELDQPKKHALALGQYSNYDSAKNICITVRRRFKDSFCKVIQRTDIPAIGTAIIRTNTHSFSTEFNGMVSLMQEDTQIQVLNTDVDTTVKDNAYKDQQYMGQFHILSNNQASLDLVQKTTLGEYLKNVVPAEIFPDAPLEALKAQSVIARTYTLKHFEPLSGQAPYSICGDTRCQVYRGFTFANPKTNHAILQTQSIFLIYGYQLAETFYHSMCGGHTEAKHLVWGDQYLPYLNGVSDAAQSTVSQDLRQNSQALQHLKLEKNKLFCGQTHYSFDRVWTWKKKFSSTTILKKLNAPLSNPVTQIDIISRGHSGRVLGIHINLKHGQKHTVLRELNIRRFFDGLRSSLFSIEKYMVQGEPHFLFEGRAFGHGVGLCQVGAIGRAENGHSYKEILKAYYPGTQIYVSENH